jgi:hypothetical protein
MSIAISRLGVLAKPARNHPEFEQWETANIIVLVQAKTREETILRAQEVLRRERWEVLAIQVCDRLIEKPVHEQGGEFLNFFEMAKTKGFAIKVFPRNFAAGRSGIPPTRAPRVTEAFMDCFGSA